MSRFIKRLESNMRKLEKRIEKSQGRIAQLALKCDSHKITKADYNLKKRHIEEQINGMKARTRVLQGGIVREKQHIGERAEEKEKKKEEKEKKKQKKEEKE